MFQAAPDPPGSSQVRGLGVSRSQTLFKAEELGQPCSKSSPQKHNPAPLGGAGAWIADSFTMERQWDNPEPPWGLGKHRGVQLVQKICPCAIPPRLGDVLQYFNAKSIPVREWMENVEP